MPIIAGLGNEVVYGAVLAAPFLFAFRSFFGNIPINTVRGSVTLIKRVFGSVFSRFRRQINQSQNRSRSNDSPIESTAPSPSPPIDQSLPDDLCSICHESFTLPCQANCGHWFCANCILSVWEYSSALATCRCPICRRPITLLLPNQSFNYPSGEEETDRIFQKIQNYNRLFCTLPRPLWQRIRDVPFFLGRFFREFRNPDRAILLLHNLRLFFFFFVVTLYVLSPLDIIPESVVGVFGLLDDLLVIACLAFYISALYRAALISGNFGTVR